MKSVLISIQPKWCELIASGKKTVEIRKSRPKIETPFKCYIYQTKESKRRYICHRFNSFIAGKVNYGSVGKVIGEFVCQAILNYECEFVDDDCYESIASIDIDEDGDKTGFIEWSNDGDIPYEGTFLYKTSRVTYEELKNYIGVGFGNFYGWHISNLVIYDKPKELSEFYMSCGDNPKCDGCEAHYYSSTECGTEDYCCSIIDGHRPLKRPPQSWCYVKGAENR